MATIRHKSLSNGWQTVGVEAHSGVWPEGLVITADKWGAKSASYTLRRQPAAIYPDLLPDTPVEIDVDGVVVFTGRVKDTPEGSVFDPQVTVECEGWQFHLDDKRPHSTYVHARLADYKDARSDLGANLAVWKATGTVEVGSGGIVIQWPNGGTVQTLQYMGVILDLGPNPETYAKRIVLEYDWIGAANANYQLYARSQPTVAALSTTANDAIGGTAHAATTGVTTAGTFPTAYRYVALFLYYAGATGVSGADIGIRIRAARTFTDTAFESGNQSILKADQVIKDQLAYAPLLATDTSGIAAGTVSIPDFAPAAPQSPRQYMEAANAPQGYQLKVDTRKRLTYRARPTTPTIEVGQWEGFEPGNLSSNSSEDIVTSVIVRGQGTDEIPMEVIRTQSGTAIDEQGGSREQVLDSRWSLTQTFAEVLGDAYLAAHASSPLRGDASVLSGGARDAASGAPIPPAHVLLMTGELMRFTDRVDPDTGNWGRTGLIAQVTWREADDVAQVSIDNSRDDLEQLNARLGLLIPT